MNTVCPGFMPHHVKPNRCRRCFKDIQDHNSSTEVTTSFTLPLPRRRRESVAVTETTRSEEPPADQSASFTMPTRQRSSSTSSWFQEKKVNNEHKEKIDSLFRNADDSRASYRSTEATDDGDISVDTVAVIRLPEPKLRRRSDRVTATDETKNKNKESLDWKSSGTSLSKYKLDETKPPDLPPKTLENKLDVPKKFEYKSKRKEESENTFPSKPSDSLNRTGSFRSRFEPQTESSKEDSSVGSLKSSTGDSLNRTSSFRSKFETSKPDSLKSELKTESSKTSTADSLNRSSSFKSKFETSTRDALKSEATPDVPKSSPSESLSRASSFKSKFETSTQDALKFEAKSDVPKSSTSESLSRSSSFKSKFETSTQDALKSEAKSDVPKSSPSESLSRASSYKSKFETSTQDSLKSDVPKSSPSDSFSRASSFKSKFETPAVESKLPDKRSLESKFNEKKPLETKFGEVKLRDTKFSEIRNRASKFETAPATDPKIKDISSKFSDTKTAKTPDSKIKTDKIETADNKIKEEKAIESPKTTTDIKPKETAKPVLARFSSYRTTEPQPVTKPPTAITKKVSSSSEEETESESEEEPKEKPKTTSITKETEKKSTPSTAAKFAVKTSSTKEETSKTEEISKQQKELDNKVKEQQDQLEQLRKELKTKEETVSRLEREKLDLQKKQQALLDKDKEALEKTAQELTKMRTKLAEMQSSQDEVKGENRKLKQEARESTKELSKSKQELKEAKDELNRLKQEAIKKQQQTSATTDKSAVEQLKGKLAQSESLCEELMEENEEIKKEVRDLEQELEELHDNFREDQASEFRGLKKELETATKNCRVLQFKLRKAEKKCELLELDRHSLEDKVREYQAAVRQDVDRSKFKELEKELSVARTLTASLSKEAKELKDALLRAEGENDALRQVAGGAGNRSVTPTSQSRLSPAIKETLSGKDYETLSHELSDTMERENDLREQLRFSEEEGKQARKKISALEQENETLMLQIKKLTHIVRNKKGAKDEDAEEEELSADNLKLQLDLMEQEMGVLRRKVDDTEKENESLHSEVKYLQEKVINQPLIELPELPKDASSPGVYWENKVRLQEYEIRETRKKLIERDREIERLNTEVEIYRKKASKVMVRSRSLDNDLQVDLKRQLQLVEQEAGILRQKLNTLEAENEKLSTENKRMNLRLSKKPPPTSADLLQLDNLELKQRLEEQQRKLEAVREELEKATADTSSVAVIQDYKPRKESLTSLLSDNESDLIASLKKRLKAKDEDCLGLQQRAMQLEIENGRLSREYKKLKDSLGSKKKPMKAIRDSATRVELRELVSELQDEISELQVTLRSREVLQESLEEELEKTKKELKDATKEIKQKEERLMLMVDKTKHENEVLKKDLESQKSRASTAEEQLNMISKQGDSSVELMRRLTELTAEKEEAEKRARAAEEALQKKTQRLRDTQEKVNATATLREDMARVNRLLESQKKDLEKEVEEQRKLLVKAEAKAAELRSQVDSTDRDLTSLRKECNQLKNELEDERSRLKQNSDKRQPDTNWSREREEYRRNINDLKNRIEQLQHQITDNEKIFIEKESRLREEFKRKRENAVKEAREKGESALELAREDEKILRTKTQELAEKLEKMENSLRESNEKSRKAASEYRREKEEWQKQRDELESEIRTEIKRREKSERDSEQILKQKEEEVLLSKERVVAVEREQRRMQMRLEEVESLQQKLKIMEQEGDRMRDEYEHLTARYDQLEDDFVKTKSKLIQEKEQAEANLSKVRKEHNELSFEMTSMKDTYNTRQDAWIKDKLDLQERAKELSKRLERLKSVEQEKRRLQDLVEEKETLIESYKKEEKYLKEERDRLRKRTEDLSKAMESKIDRPVSIPFVETGDQKVDKQLEAMRREYEGRMTMMSSEIASMQQQIASLAEERDRLKSQLSMAERNAEEMRTGSLKRERARHREEADAARRKVQELRYQLEDLREQMDDSVLENKNLKLQIETDKNAYDIQLLELKSKINQLEEQKILESTRGQTRSIAKTRLELTWEKERHELQQLLAETQRMAGELKTRVQQAEVEKDKERQATRKQMLDMRSSTEKEHQDSRRKMSELHSSLLEIRESHAKLRGMYDRMKKEREILFKEREEWRQRLQVAMQLHTKLTQLVKDVEKVSSEVSSNSEKSSLPLSAEFKETVQKVKEQFLELQKSAEILKEDERLKRTTSFRRAISAQDMSQQSQDPMQRWNNPQRVTNYPIPPPSMLIRPPPRQKTLQRKSLSLDHSMMGTTHEQRIKIWESEGESVTSTPAGSLLSLGGYGYDTDSSMPDSEYRYGGISRNRRVYRPPSGMSGMTTDSEAPYSSREGSVDPGGSSESVPLASQHQRKTFKDKLKLLRRTKSIDVSTGQKPGVSQDSKKAKEDNVMSLRSKISKVLKKPLGRSLSLESKKPAPALPPKGVVPDVVPSRPTAEKPLSASRGNLSSQRPPSRQEKRPPSSKTSSRSGAETPV